MLSSSPGQSLLRGGGWIGHGRTVEDGNVQEVRFDLFHTQRNVCDVFVTGQRFGRTQCKWMWVELNVNEDTGLRDWHECGRLFPGVVCLFAGCRCSTTRPCVRTATTTPAALALCSAWGPPPLTYTHDSCKRFWCCRSRETHRFIRCFLFPSAAILQHRGLNAMVLLQRTDVSVYGTSGPGRVWL